jgi:putative membrane protein
LFRHHKQAEEVMPRLPKSILVAAASAGALALAACGQPANEQRAEGQQNEPVNTAQDMAGAATGLATGAVGAVSSEAFVRDAAIGDMYEVAAAELALERSKDARVRAAAEKILADHKAASAKLKTLVDGGKAPGPLPTEMDERRKGMMDNLRGASDADFDDRYLDQQTMAHHEALTLFRGYAELGDNPDLKAFAGEVAPKLETHAEMVTTADRETGADDGR